MEFVEDDEPRPRFVVQSRADALPHAGPDADANANAILKTSRLHASLCLLSSLVLVLSALLVTSSQTLSFLLSWFSLSLLLAPFAPLPLTGGDIRVGLGDPLPDPPTIPDTEPKPRRRSRPQRPDPAPAVADYDPVERAGGRGGKEEEEGIRDGGGREVEEREWTEEDLEILRKQMAKHPVGTARRWELISAAFAGRHGVKSVIATAKAMAERRPSGGDSFREFLRRRKPLDGRVETAAGGDSFDGGGGALEGGEKNGGVEGSGKWSSGEDLALLNALKAFQKDTAMRWEKIAAAVPGRSKACCMKRVAELKKDYRSLKASVS